MVEPLTIYFFLYLSFWKDGWELYQPTDRGGEVLRVVNHQRERGDRLAFGEPSLYCLYQREVHLQPTHLQSMNGMRGVLNVLH